MATTSTLRKNCESGFVGMMKNVDLAKQSVFLIPPDFHVLGMGWEWIRIEIHNKIFGLKF
jgi:hypothetical protein